MHVLVDVHAGSNDQKSAFACGIASSYEDLHEVTSISSCVHLISRVSFQELCHKEWVSVWNSDQQPQFILIK